MSEEKQTFDLSATFNEHASKEAQSEATAFRTVPGGVYTLTPEKLDPVLTDDKSFWGAGKRMLRVTYNGEAKFQLDDRTPKSKFFVDYLIDEVRGEDGKLVPPSQLFLQAQKALGKTNDSLGDTIEAIRLYPVNAYITESGVLKGAGEGTKSDGSPKDKYVTIKADGTRKAEMAKLSAEGATFRNGVKNISVAK